MLESSAINQEYSSLKVVREEYSASINLLSCSFNAGHRLPGNAADFDFSGVHVDAAVVHHSVIDIVIGAIPGGCSSGDWIANCYVVVVNPCLVIVLN